MSVTEKQLQVRWLIRRDMDEVLCIEQASFNRPWTEEDFLRCLRQRNIIAMVAEHHESIVGYMLYLLCRHHIELFNFAVHPAWRRRHIGSQMASRLVGRLSSHGRSAITLTLHEANLAAQLFFRKQGFLAVDVLRAHYDGDRDGFVMRYDVPGSK